MLRYRAAGESAPTALAGWPPDESRPARPGGAQRLPPAHPEVSPGDERAAADDAGGAVGEGDGDRVGDAGV